MIDSNLTSSVRRGRLLVVIAGAVTLIGDACVTSLKISRVGFDASFASIFRWLITLALFYAIWLGYAWARWLIVILMGLGLLSIIPTLVHTWHPLMVALALQFSIGAGLLAFPRYVFDFQTFQTNNRKKE
jgi:hypothetical protein